LTQRLAQVERERNHAMDWIARKGYRRCDTPACNCPYWHGGHAETRLSEIYEQLGELTQGKTALQAIDTLQRELAAVRGELSGLKITHEQIHKALDDLGPTRDRSEAYVKVAAETLIRIMQALAGRPGEEE